jgi:hypothetical protein
MKAGLDARLRAKREKEREKEEREAEEQKELEERETDLSGWVDKTRKEHEVCTMARKSYRSSHGPHKLSLCQDFDQQNKGPSTEKGSSRRS